MTDEQINEAITQATGLWDYPYSSETKRMYDFCSDLNAMHEAENTLNMHQWRIYLLHLGLFMQDICHSSAREKAKAFLVTLNKWNDQPGERTEMVEEAQ